MKRHALVIGATGLLGYGVTHELNKDNWEVRAIGKENLINSHVFPNDVEYLCGDFYDETFLANSLRGIDKVFFFLSSTFPSTSTDSLELEISRTLRGLDYILRKMRDEGITEIVFPSSGGTIYGDVESGIAREDDILKPTTPYGTGKMMCEDVLRFYSKFGIMSTILRVGNVYGSPLARTTTQGVIDVFVQKAIRRETAIVWGSALTNVRDYIFMDDFSEAVAKIGECQAEGVEVYNLSSGIGTTLEEIVTTINKYSDEPLNIQYEQNDVAGSIRRIVLDMQKFKKKTGWEPRFDIDAGIAETIKRKRHMKEIY